MNSFGFYFAGKDILDNFIGLYNRYGKNLDYIKADRAWDGTYRGTPMSSGDY